MIVTGLPQQIAGLREQLTAAQQHARRLVFEAQEQAPRQAGWILHQMSWLYQWEAQLREERAGPVLRESKRASCHRMVVERLHRALVRL